MTSKSQNNNAKLFHELKSALLSAISSFRVLFPLQETDLKTARSLIVENSEIDFLCLMNFFINALKKDIESLEKDISTASRVHSLIDEEFDSVDYANILLENTKFTYSDMMKKCILETFIQKGFSPNFLNLKKIKEKSRILFYLQHADNLTNDLPKTVKKFFTLCKKYSDSKMLQRLMPDTDSFFSSSSSFRISHENADKTLSELRKELDKSDIFNSAQAFRYIDETFYPAYLDSIRNVDKFYGYYKAKLLFKEYFDSFASGSINYPFLISSFPGLGKTHFAISYTLANPELTLILPEPADLEEKLEALIGKLERRKNRRFVLFFDDIDTNNVNWYYFRTHVGGSFMLPDNITIVIASNYEFPANISSRGRGFVFPPFDEVLCMEMVEDFLRGMKMQDPKHQLVSVIAADYVEEFGQKKFEELSPRTLVRYLERYEKDINKRRKMLELSNEDVIAQPDTQVFTEVNIKLMEAFFGEEAVKKYHEKLYEFGEQNEF